MLFAVLFFFDKINCFLFAITYEKQYRKTKQQQTKQEYKREKHSKKEKTRDILKYFNHHQKHIYYI